MAGENKHLDKFKETQMLDGESVIAMARAYREGTSFEGAAILTDRRLCFFRAGTLSDKFEPFPLSKISSVEAKKGMLLFKMQVHTSGDDLELTLVDGAGPGATFVKRVQQQMMEPAPAPVSAQPAAAPTAADDDPITALRKLGELRDAGIVTDEEFAEKKAELLSRI